MWTEQRQHIYTGQLNMIGIYRRKSKYAEHWISKQPQTCCRLYSVWSKGLTTRQYSLAFWVQTQHAWALDQLLGWSGLCKS
jgi:hypothetical protein